MKMSMGINTNVKYKGCTYHIQTEDGGEDRPTITTLLFKDGVVASAKRRDYTDLLQSDSLRGCVTALMKEQHKRMIRALVRGEIEGLDTVAQKRSPDRDFPQKIFVKETPEAEEVDHLLLSGQEKDLDRLILEYLAKRDRNVT